VNKTRASLADIQVHVRFKLAGLWTSVMFCYVYGDIFWLYKPGKVQSMLDGKMPPFNHVTQGVLLGTSISMAIPAVMIILTLALKARASRWLNLIMGLLYAAFVAETMPGAWAFYLFFGSLDILLTALIVWYAWRWPRQLAA
jgi:Family of unknown function (DUF6326)